MVGLNRSRSATTPCAENSAIISSRILSSASWRAFKNNRDPDTDERMRDQTRTTSEVILVKLLKEPKVTYPVARAGLGPTAGASSGGR
jgi:hypothetical protein